jgi:putative transposase
MTLKATKVRIYPTTEQAGFLNQQFGSVRFVYNKALRIMSHRYKKHGDKLSAYHDMKKLLPVAKRSRKYHWLKESDSMALAQSCIDLDRAYKNFFNPKLAAKYPRFKRKHGKQSSYHCSSVSVGDNWVKVPKCQPIKARVHREIIGKVKSITLSRTATGKYYASILHDDGLQAPEVSSHVDRDDVIGLDMGLTHLLIDSNGGKVANPRFLKNASSNLRRKQKVLSRTKKGSSGRAKARLLVAKAHERTANARNDFQHKLSRNIIDENQATSRVGTGVETLKVKNMVKNRKLAKHISDAAGSSLIAKLEYKARAEGKPLAKISQWFASSKTCSCCGHKVDSLPLDIRHWD